MKIKSSFAVPFLLIVTLTLFALSALLDPAALGENVNPYLSYMILHLLVFALPSVFFCRLRGKGYATRLRLRLPHLSHLFLGLFALLLMVTGGALLRLGMTALLPTAADSGTVAAEGDIFYAVIAYCLLPAVTEEFLFRGITLAEYESYSPGAATLLSALLFAMIHLSFADFPVYFFCGIVLALLLYATRSILMPMLVHALYNIASLLLGPYIGRAAGQSSASGELLFFILATAFFISLILFAMEGQRIYTDYGVTNVPSPHVRRRRRGEKVGTWEAFVAPPFILFVLMFAVMTVLLGS